MMPIAIGTNIRPAASADAPRTCWTYRPITNTIPYQAVLTAKPVARMVSGARPRNRPSGTTGAATRDSTRQKTTHRDATATANAASTRGEAYPAVPPSIMA